MFSLPRIYALCKRRFGRTVSLACVVGFIMVFLLAATQLTALAAHNHESIPGCLRTGGPVCACDSTGAPALTQARDSTWAATGADAQPQANDDAKAGCLACALILKIVNPLRESIIAASSAIHADFSLFAFAALGFLLILSGFLTPVRLKSKMSN